MLGFLKRLRHGWRGPDPKWSDRHVIESRRDPRSEALARRLDKAEPFASFSFESAVTDPETGWAWSVADEPGPDGEPARRLRSVPASRVQALAADPASLARSPPP